MRIAGVLLSSFFSSGVALMFYEQRTDLHSNQRKSRREYCKIIFGCAEWSWFVGGGADDIYPKNQRSSQLHLSRLRTLWLVCVLQSPYTNRLSACSPLCMSLSLLPHKPASTVSCRVNYEEGACQLNYSAKYPGPQQCEYYRGNRLL